MQLSAAPPDIDRRELLEAVAVRAVPRAAGDVQREVTALLPASVGADTEGEVHSFAATVLQAVLRCYVQGALSISERQSLAAQAEAFPDQALVDEILRTTRHVGIEIVAAHARREMALHRTEYQRLRTMAERVSGLVRAPEEVPPAGRRVLERLYKTGPDLR